MYVWAGLLIQAFWSDPDPDSVFYKVWSVIVLLTWIRNWFHFLANLKDWINRSDSDSFLDPIFLKHGFPWGQIRIRIVFYRRSESDPVNLNPVAQPVLVRSQPTTRTIFQCQKKRRLVEWMVSLLAVSLWLTLSSMSELTDQKQKSSERSQSYLFYIFFFIGASATKSWEKVRIFR